MTAEAGAVEAGVRRRVQRFVWLSNEHSVALGAVAIGFARLIDQGDRRAVPDLKRVLGQLQQCGPDAEGIEGIQARYARKRLAGLLGRAAAEG